MYMGGLKEFFCAINVMLHSKPLLQKTVTSCQYTVCCTAISADSFLKISIGMFIFLLEVQQECIWIVLTDVNGHTMKL